MKKDEFINLGNQLRWKIIDGIAIECNREIDKPVEIQFQFVSGEILKITANAQANDFWDEWLEFEWVEVKNENS